jgi:hypothetical protein
MMRKTMKRKAVGLAAAAFAFAQPAQATMSCWGQQEAAAAKIRDLQSRLMVATMRCRAMGVDVLSAYNDFVRVNRTTIQEANGLIKAQFAQGYGSLGDTFYDRFTTALANEYGADPTDGEICDETADAAWDASAAQGDVQRLLDVADRLGPPPRLPGGECPISFVQAAKEWGPALEAQSELEKAD